MTDFDRKDFARKSDAMVKSVSGLRDACFDSVWIMASFVREDGKTSIIRTGFGNWYAVLGMLQYEMSYREGMIADDVAEDAKDEAEDTGEGDE